MAGHTPILQWLPNPIGTARRHVNWPNAPASIVISNETTWPWYSNIAPVSWLVQHDVDEGRQHLNFSEWGVARSGRQRREGHGLDEMGEVILEGEMPPAQFLLTHPEARLTETEKQALADGLAATLSQ